MQHKVKGQPANLAIMDITTIVEDLSRARPKVIGRVTHKRAVTIVEVVLAELRKKITSVDECVIEVPQLGRFSSRKISRKDEAGVEKAVRRITFFPKKLKANVAGGRRRAQKKE